MTATKTKAKKSIQLKNFDEEKLNEEVIELINCRGLNEYKKGYVGLYAYSDASGAAGGGTGCFLWFPSFQELYQFLADYFVVWLPGPVCVDHGLVFHKVGKIVQELASGSKTKNEAMQLINQAAKGFSQIEWMGDMESLCAGDETFAKTIRGQFYDANESEKGGRIIQKDDRQRFIEFLKQYGF